MHLPLNQTVSVVLFLGSFGTILYTGDFRYDQVMLQNKVLAHVVKNEVCK
jgi:hypothetical protein